MAMGSGTNATYTLGNLLGVQGVPSFQNNLPSPEHFTGAVSVNYFATLHFHIYFEMALYTR
jgi:hypothetical protein